MTEPEAGAVTGGAGGGVTPEPGGDRWLLLTSDVATATFVIVSAVTVAVMGPLRPAVVVVSLVALAVGSLTFLWGFAVAVGRSRAEVVNLAELVTLRGVAPAKARRRFLVAVAIQVVAGVTVAALRPYTVCAFAVLGPMLGLGLMVLWTARNGTFPAREPPGP